MANALKITPSWLVLGLVSVGAILLPLLTGNAVWLDLGVRTFYYLMLVIGWNLLAGFTGQFSFGHVALAAVGGYGSAIIVGRLGMGIPVAMILGAVVAGLAGCILGIISIRIRGVYLVMTTFALMRVIQIILYAEHDLTGGASGLPVPMLFRISDVTKYYALGLGLTGVMLLTQWWILRGRVGHYLAAIREDESAARAIGINARLWKIVMFSYSSAWAGAAGAFAGHYAGFLSPNMGSVSEMSLVLAMGTIGGLGSVVGPVLSTILLQIASDQLQDFGGLSALLFGGVLMAVVVGFPEGIGGLLKRVNLWAIHKRKPRDAAAKNSSHPGMASHPIQPIGQTAQALSPTEARD